MQRVAEGEAILRTVDRLLGAGKAVPQVLEMPGGGESSRLILLAHPPGSRVEN